MNTEQYHIDVSGFRVDVTRKNIKNIHLSVYPPDGGIRVSSPHSVSQEALRQFLVSKLGWIKRHVRRMESLPRRRPLEYISGESHYVQGQRYLLNVIERDAPPKVVLRNKKYIDLYIRTGSGKEKREEVVREWYRGLLKEELPDLIEKWEPKLGVKVQDWGVKRMKTKWGSCNTKAHRIWLNLELAKKPKHCLDYVVLHEIVHLKERLHNDRFYAYLDELMPGWTSVQEELNGLQM